MELIEPIDEDAMILTWVDAERERVRQVTGMTLPTALTPGVARDALAKSRGYPNTLIFKGWPNPMAWSRATATVEELGGFLHLNYPTFVTVTQGSRLPRDAAANIGDIKVGEGLNEIVPQIAAAVRDGLRPPPLVAAAVDETSQPILAEGNKRAIAYQLALSKDEPVEFFFGASPALSGWHFF